MRDAGTYRIIAQARIESDLSQVVVYQSEKDGSVWIRQAPEFCDGRFVPLNE